MCSSDLARTVLITDEAIIARIVRFFRLLIESIVVFLQETELFRRELLAAARLLRNDGEPRRVRDLCERAGGLRPSLTRFLGDLLFAVAQRDGLSRAYAIVGFLLQAPHRGIVADLPDPFKHCVPLLGYAWIYPYILFIGGEGRRLNPPPKFPLVR